MDKLLLLYTLITLVLWGVSAFADKISADKLGFQGVWIWIFSAIPSLIVLLVYGFFAQKMGFDKAGVWWVVLSFILTSLGGITYYLVFTRTGAGAGATMSALYPIVTIILGVIFLNERFDWSHKIGMLLGLVAIYLLSR